MWFIDILIFAHLSIILSIAIFYIILFYHFFIFLALHLFCFRQKQLLMHKIFCCFFLPTCTPVKWVSFLMATTIKLASCSLQKPELWQGDNEVQIGDRERAFSPYNKKYLNIDYHGRTSTIILLKATGVKILKTHLELHSRVKCILEFSNWDYMYFNKEDGGRDMFPYLTTI